MEKYLKKTDVSVGSDASVAHTTFNLTAWGDGINDSQTEDLNVQKLTISKAQDREDAAKTTLAKASPIKALSAGAKRESRRSSIPRPCSYSRASTGAEQASAVKPKAEIVGSCHKSSLPVERTITVAVDDIKGLQPQIVNSKTSLEASQRTSIGCTDSPCLPPAPRVEQLSSTWPNGSSTSLPSAKSGIQPQEDNQSVSMGKNPTLKDSTSEAKNVGVSKPTPNPGAGELTGFLTTFVV